ncbi:MAG: hypothetical protein AB1898_09005 [Acidobacteriota bacterium]
MDFYLIRNRKGAPLLYTESEHLPQGASGTPSNEASDPVDRLVSWLDSKPGRLAKFFKETIVIVRDIYFRLEDKIDPMERVLKRMRHARKLRILHSARLGPSEAATRLETFLSRQRTKHLFWLVIDLVLSGGALLLSPFLVPIPGPNVFLYYPVLRLFSHYLAIRGAQVGGRAEIRTLYPTPELSDLEEILTQPCLRRDPDKLRELSGRLRLEHLPRFLERYC